MTETKGPTNPENGKPGLPPADVAFNTIVKDIGVVFHLNYREEMFLKWKGLATTALNSYLGEGHALTLEFHEITWHDPAITDGEAGHAMTSTDEMMYSAGLESAKDLLERARDEAMKGAPLVAGKAAEPPPPPPLLGEPPSAEEPVKEETRIDTSSVPEIKIIRAVGSAATIKSEEEEDGPARMNRPRRGAAGLDRIPTAPGRIKKDTLDSMISNLDNPKEKQLVEDLREILDDPRPSWGNVRRVLLEIYEVREELLDRLMPLILH